MYLDVRVGDRKRGQSGDDEGKDEFDDNPTSSLGDHKVGLMERRK
jgi:hypothetical protein